VRKRASQLYSMFFFSRRDSNPRPLTCPMFQ